MIAATPALASAPAKGRIPSLDGLRAASILLVMLGHGHMSFPLHGVWAERFWTVANNGHLGVTVFFVISGFLITTLLRGEMEKSGRISLKAFYQRRTLRIFPAFYVFLAVVALLAHGGLIPLNRTQLALAATYTMNYQPLSAPWNLNAHHEALSPEVWYTGHLWSLSVEEQFYLFWPLLLAAAGLGRGAWIAFGIMCAEPFLRVATHFLVPPLRGISATMLPWALDPMMVGSLAALWQGHPRFEAAVRRLHPAWVPLLAAVFLLGFTAPLADLLRGGWTLFFAPTLESLAILAVLMWLVRHPASAAGRVFNHPAVAFVGTLSYSLYLWQQVFLVHWLRDRWPVQVFPWNFLCCFAAALASYFLVEKPFLRWKHRFERVAVGGRNVMTTEPAGAVAG